MFWIGRDFFIPDSVLTIGEMAFKSCIRLRKVKLSNNIVSISAGVFANCIENEKLVIPDIARKFERGCFKGSGIQK